MGCLYILVFEAAFTRGGLSLHHQGRCFAGSQNTEAPSPDVATFIGFSAQAKPVRFESAGASALKSHTFGFNPGGATGTKGIGVCLAEVC